MALRAGSKFIQKFIFIDKLICTKNMSKFIHSNEWFELCIISQENINAVQHRENQTNDLAQYYPYETILFHNRLFFIFDLHFTLA